MPILKTRVLVVPAFSYYDLEAKPSECNNPKLCLTFFRKKDNAFPCRRCGNKIGPVFTSGEPLVQVVL